MRGYWLEAGHDASRSDLGVLYAWGVGSISGKEWLRAAAGGVAGQPVQDQRPGLGGVGEVDLGVSFGEAVVAEQHAGSSWGPGSLVETGELRSRYVSALRVADRDLEYEPLLRFARRGG